MFLKNNDELLKPQEKLYECSKARRQRGEPIKLHRMYYGKMEFNLTINPLRGSVRHTCQNCQTKNVKNEVYTDTYESLIVRSNLFFSQNFLCLLVNPPDHFSFLKPHGFISTRIIQYLLDEYPLCAKSYERNKIKIISRTGKKPYSSNLKT